MFHDVVSSSGEHSATLETPGEREGCTDMRFGLVLGLTMYSGAPVLQRALDWQVSAVEAPMGQMLVQLRGLGSCRGLSVVYIQTSGLCGFELDILSLPAALHVLPLVAGWFG